jgi:protein TonB
MAYSEQTDWTTEPRWDLVRRRGFGLVIALLLEALIILAILSLSMRSGGPAAGTRGLNSFSLEAEADSASSADKNETKTPVIEEQKSNVTPPIPKPLLPPVNRVKAPPPSPDYIKVSKSDFDTMDLSKFPASGGSGSGEGKGHGQGAKGMMGPGLGPGGAQLYPVAWLREPYDSELAPYLAAVNRVPPGASADIACRMAEHNRVENCQILGENPRGTGLAKALRLAAWQFLVKPPRIDNKPQLGVWVRIHFDFGVKPEYLSENFQ